MELTEKLKLLCGESPCFTDEIIAFQIEAAERDILNYCHIDAVPEALEHLRLDLTLKRLNRMGQEGSKSYSEGALSYSFDEYLTDDIKTQLRAFRKVVF